VHDRFKVESSHFSSDDDDNTNLYLPRNGGEVGNNVVLMVWLGLILTRPIPSRLPLYKLLIVMKSLPKELPHHHLKFLGEGGEEMALPLGLNLLSEWPNNTTANQRQQ